MTTHQEWMEEVQRRARAKDRERNLANVQRINRDLAQAIGPERWEREYFVVSNTRVSMSHINGG